MTAIAGNQDYSRPSDYYAHTPPEGSDRWHPLAEHLTETAIKASSMGRNRTEKETLFLAGLLHDLGKYQDEFQNYLNARYRGKEHDKVPHAMLGAQFAYKHAFGEVAFAIAGHHSGIPNLSDFRNSLERLQSQLGDKDDALVRLLEADLSDTIIIPAESLNAVDEYDFDTITRYLYSCLVDADFLDTEQHFDPRRAESREARDLQPDTLLEKLNHRLESFKLDTPINRLRTAARSECVGNAQKKPGIYTLILPTGLGKTLTSVAWALEHARWNSLKRIIIVLPYTNIIDQTAMQLKSIFGEETVLEHHSGIADRDDEERSYDRRKLATENWSSPIIITTTVQFFESLFSNRSSKCRKVHNIADSVVIFDEVQTLPKESIKPTLRMLTNVQNFFGASLLFCTATMPALKKRKGFVFGIENIVPLVQNPEPIFEKTRRVHYSALNGLEEVEERELIDLAQKEQKSVLVIFNSKKDALRAFQTADVRAWERVYHLSTAMCPRHRKTTLRLIRAALKAKRRILAITTQLVEAGVDFDFPVVYRAIAPLDSIIQAAGRCNREGKLKTEDGQPALGDVSIFRTKNMGMPHDKTYKTATAFTETFIKGRLAELNSPTIYTDYYDSLMRSFINEDKADIDGTRKSLQFADVAARYKIIDSPAQPVFVRGYNKKSEDLFRYIQSKPFISRRDGQRLQEFTIQLYPDLFQKAGPLIEKLPNGISVWNGRYNVKTGVQVELDAVDSIL